MIAGGGGRREAKADFDAVVYFVMISFFETGLSMYPRMVFNC